MLNKWLCIYSVILIICSCTNTISTSKKSINNRDSFLKLEMYFDPYQAEGNWPFISVKIDFVKQTSECKRWNENPEFKDSFYSFSKMEMDSIFYYLNKINLDSTTRTYDDKKVDPHKSRTIIYTKLHKYWIWDYGLHGDYPMPLLYHWVYKF